MKLHLGSGKVRLEGWVNVDLDAPEADLLHDLRNPLPFEDESVEYIFNEHFIEHVTRKEALTFLRECKRVLKPNGVIRLSTPNLKFLVECYLKQNIGEWGYLWRPATPCTLMNEGMRLWGHKFLYDSAELALLLSDSGFKFFRFAHWRKSSINELANLENRPFHRELIVEAYKNKQIDCYQQTQDIYYQKNELGL